MTALAIGTVVFFFLNQYEEKKEVPADKINKNLISSKSEAGMSNEDVKCYVKRYKDLYGMEAREHFLTIGKK